GVTGNAHREPGASARGVPPGAARVGGGAAPRAQPPERGPDAERRGPRGDRAPRARRRAARRPRARPRRRRRARLEELAGVGDGVTRVLREARGFDRRGTSLFTPHAFGVLRAPRCRAPLAKSPSKELRGLPGRFFGTRTGDLPGRSPGTVSEERTSRTSNE